MPLKRKLEYIASGILLFVVLLVVFRFRNIFEVADQTHPKDAVKKSEDQALIRLMPDNNLTTHVAVNSGLWSSANVWANGMVPERGAIVRIPRSVTVTYETDSPAHLFIVRVDGTLRLKARQRRRTKMIVDTLFGTEDSNLFIEADSTDDGTIEIQLRPFNIQSYKEQGAPAWGQAAKDYYSDGAPVTDTGAGSRNPEAHETVSDGPGVLGRYEWDPKQLSLGLVTHGKARISGRKKRSRSAIQEIAKKGDTAIILSSEPEEWAVGDVIIITGTHYVGRDSLTGGYRGSEDEIRTIAGIRGNKVTFDLPLEYNHDTPRDHLKAHAANLTRNILIYSSENRPLYDLDADSIGRIATKLGHVMFMHTDDVRVRYAAFDHLGRTNKNDVADDFLRKRDGIQYPRIKGWKRNKADKITNVRGRYAVHLHRAGATETDKTALVEGSVVTGGPGWGFVSHDSRADFLRNVTYGVLGVGFVAETGNETGTWEGNIAINTYGADFNSSLLEPRFGISTLESGEVLRFVNNDFEGTVLLEKRGAWKNHEFGHFGNGFWFQGKLIDVKNNVSVNSALWGYFFMFRGPGQRNVDRDVLEEPLTVHSPKGIHPHAPGLNVFTGNQSIADRGGLVMIGNDSGRANDETSLITDFTAWEVGQTGTRSQYYPSLTIKNSTFIASTSPNANPTDGVFLDKMQMITVLANLRIEGFSRKYNCRKEWSEGTELQGFSDPYEVIAEAKANGQRNPLPLGYAHVIIDGGFTRAQAAENRFMGSTYREEDTILASGQLHIGRFKIEFDDSSLKVNLDNKKIIYGVLNDPVRPTLQEGHVLLLRGTKTDCIGKIPINYHNNVLVWHEDGVQNRLQNEGYYRMPNGSLGVILEEVFSDRYTAEKHIVRFVAELDPRWDLSKAIDCGEFKLKEHPAVYVPGFLLGR